MPYSGLILKQPPCDAQESWNLLGSDKYNYEKSKQFVGTSIPDLQGGFGTSLRVYNIDLSVQFSYQIGGKFYDYQYSSLMGTGDLGRNWHTDIRKRWTPENRNTDVPRLEFAGLQGSSSDRFFGECKLPIIAQREHRLQRTPRGCRKTKT